MDPLQHEAVALEHRTVDQRLDPCRHDSSLLAESDDDGVGTVRYRDSETSPRVERTFVDRGHEVLGKDTTHDLANGIRRHDARDTEPVSDLGGDRRLAHAGRPADEHDERVVELGELVEADVAAERTPRPPSGRGTPRQAAQPRDRERGLAALTQVVLNGLGDLVTRCDGERPVAVKDCASSPLEKGRPCALSVSDDPSCPAASGYTSSFATALDGRGCHRLDQRLKIAHRRQEQGRCRTAPSARLPPRPQPRRHRSPLP